MEKRIKLDIVSDVVCPWCVIGYKHLEAAIKELGLADRVDIEWQPFELNPDMPAEGENLREHIARKYGSSPQESQAARDNLTRLGAEHGFRFDYFDDMRMVNTFNAHILLELAHEKGIQTALKLRLFEAFFTERKDISDREVLLNEAAAAGLDREEAEKQLDNEVAQDTVRSVEAQWTQLGISGVPTVIFNRASAVTGAQPVETFKQILTELSQ